MLGNTMNGPPPSSRRLVGTWIFIENKPIRSPCYHGDTNDVVRILTNECLNAKNAHCYDGKEHNGLVRSRLCLGDVQSKLREVRGLRLAEHMFIVHEGLLQSQDMVYHRQAKLANLLDCKGRNTYLERHPCT